MDDADAVDVTAALLPVPQVKVLPQTRRAAVFIALKWQSWRLSASNHRRHRPIPTNVVAKMTKTDNFNVLVLDEF